MTFESVLSILKPSLSSLLISVFAQIVLTIRVKKLSESKQFFLEIWISQTMSSDFLYGKWQQTTGSFTLCQGGTVVSSLHVVSHRTPMTFCDGYSYLSSSPFYRCGNPGKYRMRNLPMITYLSNRTFSKTLNHDSEFLSLYAVSLTYMSLSTGY